MAVSKSSSQRSVAISGGGSGLGRDIALCFADKGYSVYGTATSEKWMAEVTEASGGRVKITVCDITDEQAVKAWAAAVSGVLGDAGLDLLISNAGVLTPGPMEAIPLDAIRHEFEVNTFGAVSVINAFLPALRKARGRIVHISTWTAQLPLPFNGPSGASKAAMDAFAMVYRAELKPFGIDVVIVPAGNMKTGGPAKSSMALARMAKEMTSEQHALYGDEFATFTNIFNSTQASGVESLDAARQVIAIAEQEVAPSQAPLGQDAEEILRAVRERSDDELDGMRRLLLGLE